MDTIDYEDCPHCSNVGWYADANTHTGDPEQVQCEFCYTTENSIFNVIQRLQAEKKYILSKVGVDEHGIYSGHSKHDTQLSQRWIDFHLETEGKSEFEKREAKRGVFHWLHDTGRITGFNRRNR